MLSDALRSNSYLTDGGLETDLIFNHGMELPQRAAYPLLETFDGRALLTSYYQGYAAIARAAGVPLMLETPTWRASKDWGARLGHDSEELRLLNSFAVTWLRTLAEDQGMHHGFAVSGSIGPRGDGYAAATAVDPAEAWSYHRRQINALADAEADLVTAYTLTDPGEAAGIVQAAREAGLPVAISYTIETDGTLPGGGSLGAAIEAVDADYFLLNCAHPRHVLAALANAGSWVHRIEGVRYNASTHSHAELDNATDLDVGDLDQLVAGHAEVTSLLPNLRIVGGCCGTDTSHVAALWSVS